MTGRCRVSSRASSGGRKNGTSQESARAASAIAGSSVESTMRSNAAERCATAMVYAMSGLPASSFRFFPGTAFEPPLAVMTPSVLRSRLLAAFGVQTLLKILPRDQPIRRDRSPGHAPDNLAEVTCRDPGAGTLRPHIGGGNRRACRDVPNRDHAVMRHVPHVLLAGLNRLRCTPRLLDRADPAHQLR